MAKLGTREKPLVLRVQTQAYAEELLAYCSSRNWTAIVGVEADKSENISDLQHMRQSYPTGSLKTGRNKPCVCGSGKKYKNCCLKYGR